MPSAAKVLIAVAATAALAACSRSQQQPAENQDMSVESNLTEGRLPPGAEIETLPPDESSATSSGELNAGDDNPDVHDLNATSNSD
jgi:hypothetical protein